MEELQTIKLNAIIDVQISQAYYVQLQNIIINLMKTLNPEQLKTTFKNIENNTNKSLLDETLHLLSVLLVDIEINARNQDKLEKLNIEKVPESTTNES